MPVVTAFSKRTLPVRAQSFSTRKIQKIHFPWRDQGSYGVQKGSGKQALIEDKHQLVSELTRGIQNRVKRKNCEQENNSNSNKKPKFTFNLSTTITKGRQDMTY